MMPIVKKYLNYQLTKKYELAMMIQKKIWGKKLDKVMYYRHTGWLGHLKQRTARQFQEQDPTGFVEAAIKGMLPHNTLGRKQGMKLFVYAGSEHPHAAQKPEELKIKG